MSWITVIWAMAASACVTMALPHLAIWVQRRSQVAHLLFALSALGAAGNALAELGMLKATTVEGYALALRALFVPVALFAVSWVWYVRNYLGGGRRSLAMAVTIAWLLVLIIDAFSPFSPVFREISGLRIVQTPWGEPFALAKGTTSPLSQVLNFTDLMVLVFVVDVSATLWRRGNRRRAMLFGIGIVGAVVAAVIQIRLVDAGVLQMPYVVTFVYIGIIIALGYPLSADVLRAAQLAQQLQASEVALRESEARMNLATNAANLGLWVWNIGDDELWVTEKWRMLFGFAESEPVNFGQLLQVVHPEDRERMKQTVQDMLEHGGSGEHESEYRITRPDGSTRWIAGYGGVELDERGKPAFARGVSRDITKRKVVEEELRESEARFRAVADAAPVLIWMSGPDKFCTFFNKGWLDFTGRSLEQELGNGWAEGVHREDFDRCLDIYRNSFDARQPFTMEYRLRRSDGEYRWVLDIGTPRFASDGAFLGYIGSCIDITERKRAEEKFGIVLDAAPNAMIMVDSAGVISFANAPAAAVFGYPLSELIGRPIETLIPERFDDRQAGYRKGFLSDPSNRPMGAGRDLFGRRKNGTEFPVEVGLNPIRTTEGLFVLASVIDITARKQAELEHQRQNMELARVGRVAVMGELAASLAHEVNNPLAAIVTNASAGQRLIAAGKIETEELNELLGDIVADGRRAGEIVQGIRNMVRKGKAPRSLVEISDTIHDLLRIVHAEALGRDVTVAAEIDSDGGRVLADPVQLLQVLLNLTLNAFEAMSAMRPDARHLVIRAGRNGDGEIVVSVRDTGPGFPGGIVDQLFEPFFSTKAEGTGMGLAIARSIVEAHGGVLSGENCDHGGACFTVRLPEAQEDKPRAA
jgi:two-component system, LuxR family, sensor kinase FixL